MINGVYEVEYYNYKKYEIDGENGYKELDVVREEKPTGKGLAVGYENYKIMVIGNENKRLFSLLPSDVVFIRKIEGEYEFGRNNP